MATSIAAPPAAGSGAAPEPCPAPSKAYMVSWREVTVTLRGQTRVWHRLERLQSTSIAAELAVLEQLADLGALTRVIAVPAADFFVAVAAAGSYVIGEAEAIDGPVPASATPLPVVCAGNVSIVLLPS